MICFGLIACVLYGLGAGLRGDIGILLPSLVAYCDLSYQEVSFCIAVMNLVFGAVQPAFGMYAARTSNRRVLLIGAGLLGISLLGMIGSRSFAALLLFLGFAFGAGAGALAFGLILSSAMRFVGPDRAMLISGMLNAAAGLGSFVLSPTLQALLDSGGLAHTLVILLVPVFVLVPVTLAVTSADPKRSSDCGVCEQESGRDSETRGAGLFKRAFRDKAFVCLVAGFSTCGFHMVIIESHLFSQYVSYGIGAAEASWGFSLYGIATILGALLSGWLSARVSKGALLAFYYGFRAVWVIAFMLFMPKTLLGAVIFSVGLGLTGDATVSPTAGVVNGRFSVTESATLIGLLFFCHQIGAFSSAWFGGLLLDATGSYGAIWAIDVGLCTFAAVASSRIRKNVQRKP